MTQDPNAEQPAEQPPEQQRPPPYPPSPPPSGYPPPMPVYPPQGQPPQPGYAPPGYIVPGTAQGYPPNGDEKLWALLSHGSFFVLGIIGPLIVMLTKGKESPFIRRHAVEALNFHLSVLIYELVSFVLMLVLVGFLTFVAVLVFGLVVTILAMIAANNGADYRYPLNIRMVT